MQAQTKRRTISHASRNGRAEASPAPCDAASNGRQTNGQFARGNAFGCGNPTARKMAALRSSLLKSVDDGTLDQIGRKLVEASLQGDWVACRLLLEYAVGKARPAPDADRLDLDEIKLFFEIPQILKFVQEAGWRPTPSAALELLQTLLLKDAEQAALKGREELELLKRQHCYIDELDNPEHNEE